MEIAQAQRDVRTTFEGGFVGGLVSSGLWLVSAALGTWSTPRNAILALVVGGFFIFPATQLVLKLTGRAHALPPGHPMNAFALQVAFTLPLNLPLVGAATLYKLGWFYPAFMIVLGTHYLPFVFLYGMWQFYVLAGFLVGAGFLLGTYLPLPFPAGGWITAITLLAFAFAGRAAARQ